MKGIFRRIFSKTRKPIPNIGKVAIGFLGFWATVWIAKQSKLSDVEYILKKTPLNQEIVTRMHLFGKVNIANILLRICSLHLHCISGMGFFKLYGARFFKSGIHSISRLRGFRDLGNCTDFQNINKLRYTIKFKIRKNY